MDLAIVLAKQVCSMLIYLVSGFIAYKKGLVSLEQSKGISAALMYIFAPCLLFQSFQQDFKSEKLEGLLFAVFTSIIANLFFIFLAKYVFIRKQTKVVGIERSSLIYTNAGYLAIPLIGAALGFESIFYSTGYLIIFNILLWTHCLFLISGDKSKINIKKIIFNPNVIAIILGLIAFILNYRIPKVISTATIGMSNLVGPLSLFIIGIILGSTNLKDIFQRPRIFYIISLRLLILPGLLVFVFKLFHITALIPNGKEIITIVLVACCAPIATSVSIFSHQFDNDADYASKLTVLSTLLCVITMPLILALSQYIL